MEDKLLRRKVQPHDVIRELGGHTLLPEQVARRMEIDEDHARELCELLIRNNQAKREGIEDCVFIFEDPALEGVGNGKESTTCTTFTTFTTKLKNWGYYNPEEQLLIEQIDETHYLCITPSSKKVVLVEKKVAEKGQKGSIYCLNFNGKDYFFEKKPKKPPYYVPPLSFWKDYLDGVYPVKTTEELKNKLLLWYGTLYDFKNNYDVYKHISWVLSAWLKPHLSTSWFSSIDSTKGGGKTTLLEIDTFLARHGRMIGDTSAAAIPRMKEEFDVTFGIDEIDQLPPETREVVEGLLRKGQRRYNFYTRVNKHTLEPESFDAFGFYCFTYRSSVADDLLDRSLPTHSAKSKDKMLPVINSEKTRCLKPLADDLWVWYIDNFFEFGSKVVKVVQVVGVSDTATSEISPKKLRKKLYHILTKDFSKTELGVLNELIGRNIELGYTILRCLRVLNLDFSKEIKGLLTTKQTKDDIPDNFYYQKLRDVIQIRLEICQDVHAWELEKGDFAGCLYYPKTDLYTEFIKELKEGGINTIGTPKFNSLLRDMGFVSGHNMDKNQKHRDKKIPVPCLIFTNDILEKLGIELSRKEGVAEESTIDSWGDKKEAPPNDS